MSHLIVKLSLRVWERAKPLYFNGYFNSKKCGCCPEDWCLTWEAPGLALELEQVSALELAG